VVQEAEAGKEPHRRRPYQAQVTVASGILLLLSLNLATAGEDADWIITPIAREGTTASADPQPIPPAPVPAPPGKPIPPAPSPPPQPVPIPPAPIR
jgi:hypothetical protein